MRWGLTLIADIVPGRWQILFGGQLSMLQSELSIIGLYFRRCLGCQVRFYVLLSVPFCIPVSLLDYQQEERPPAQYRS